MKKIKILQEKRRRRQKRVRIKIQGAKEKPRLCVFRSNKHIYGQLIDDIKGKTLLSVSDLKTQETRNKRQETGSRQQKTGEKKQETMKRKKIDIAFETGKLIAEKAKELKIKKVIFDRGKYKYHGRVKALAEGARQGGLIF